MNDSIVAFVEQKAINLSGIKVFKPEDAIELLILLEQNKVPIYGFDAFFVNEEGHRPSLADSMDSQYLFRKGMSKEQATAEMIQMIKDRANVKDIFFEIVYKRAA